MKPQISSLYKSIYDTGCLKLVLNIQSLSALYKNNHNNNTKTVVKKLSRGVVMKTDFISECCSSCGTSYNSLKASKIERNNGEVWRKPFRSF